MDRGRGAAEPSVAAAGIYTLAARMSAYYVIAIVTAVGAVVLSAIGLTREDFPPSPVVGRALVGGAALLVLSGVVALLVTTHREHPREEAAEAAEKAAPEKGGGEAKAGQPAPRAAGQKVAVKEKEFSIALEGSKDLKPGSNTFDVTNEGKIQHDLAIEGNGLPNEPKTPLIDPGKSATLNADLKPGKYKLYCTVPGHEQSGMKTDVTVR
jgi:uncharacterized cupredoxin-like copper-binding protein